MSPNNADCVPYSLVINKESVLFISILLSRIQLMRTIDVITKLQSTIQASCSMEFFVQLKQIELHITVNKGEILIQMLQNA